MRWYKSLPQAAMLIGEHLHTLDPKKRVSLPSKFRKELGKTVVITRGLDHCLFIYSVKEWKQFTEKLSQLSMGQADSRAFNRFLLGGAVETDIDSNGRVLIPDFLKDFASLETRVVIAGMHNRVEVWDEKRWKDYTSTVEKNANDLAEKLGSIGMM